MKLLASLLTAAVLVAPAVSAFAADGAAKPDLAKGKESYAGVCIACHGEDGNSLVPNQPNLAQQHPEYLIKQLKEYKEGKRVDPIMAGMAGMLEEADMKNIAYWVTTQQAKPTEVESKDLVALGERIYRGGLPDRQIAACAGCHSPSAAGIPAQYPRLAGQHAEYTKIQLTAFRDGTRTNSAQMTGVAAKMNDREIKAVSDYMAGLK